MKVHLERIDPDAHMARFYKVQVIPTLFGEWAVVREWGRIGQGGTVREVVLATKVQAIDVAGQHVMRKRRRGYRTSTPRDDNGESS
ncbi:MAG: WGR domain-containing protein [Nitrospiraceae bacterium]